MTNTIRLSELLADGPTPPSEFRIFKMGKNETSKGTFIFDEESAKSVLADWREHETELSMDYEHAAVEESGNIATGAPAAAWFKLALRSDGLYAVDVRWTPRAEQYLKGKEYRYYSPAFVTDKKGRILRLVNIALTNLPATRGLTPLVAAKDKTMADDNKTEKTPLEEQLSKLSESVTCGFKGLSDRFDDHEARMQKLEGKPDEDDKKDDVEESDDDSDTEAMKGLSDEIVSLTGKKTAKGATAKILSWKLSAEKLPGIETELNKLKSDAQEAAVVALVDGAIKSGKLTKAQRDDALKLGRKDLDTLKGMISLGAVHPARVEHRESEADEGTLTDDEKKAAKLGGVTEAAFLARKKARLSK